MSARSRVIQGIEGVEQRREVELRCRLLPAGRGDGITRVAGELEETFVDLAIALGDLFRNGVAQFFQLLDVSTCSFGEIALTALHVALKNSKYFAWPPVQKATRLGSFHTSSGHWATSSTP